MFTFKKSIINSGIFNGMCDVHTHILPSVDDGVHSMDETLQVLSYYEELGIKKVILTPHIMSDLPYNNAEYLSREFENLKNLYKGDIELSLGAEYMLDSDFHKHLKSGKLLPLFENYLLVEMSYAVETANLTSIIAEIMSAGYFVVLAHPERYLYLDYKVYRRLKNMDVLFQLNILSLAGNYGKRVKERATKLLDDGMYDMIGSDLHNLAAFQQSVAKIKLRKTQIGKLLEISKKFQ